MREGCYKLVISWEDTICGEANDNINMHQLDNKPKRKLRISIAQ